MAGTGNPGASLDRTPTWAMASVFFFVVFVSLLVVRSSDVFRRWLRRRGKTNWIDALERIREELMIMGFISLLLAVVQKPVSKICVSTKVADTLLPCRHNHDVLIAQPDSGESRRRLFSVATISWRRELASSAGLDHCASRGMVSLVSEDGVHQLHILIFVFAAVHILYSVLTMALGNAKMRRWKAWERETQTLEYQVANDPRRFRLTRETTYARRHVNFWTKTPCLTWITCFFRQFFSSVAKVDYLTLRHGFISSRSFNFQKYIERSLEEDFKTVLRISPTMWLLVIIFLLIDVYGWYSYFWLSFLPLIAVLAAGTKLQFIVAKMARQLSENALVVSGPPRVQLSDNLFWFGKPKLVLFLIHFTLFQNAFQLSFFLWVWYEFGLSSCYHAQKGITIARISLALVVQLLCSYITLPLYALVTQMGSKFSKTMFEEKMAKVLREWHEDVRRKKSTTPLSTLNSST